MIIMRWFLVLRWACFLAASLTAVHANLYHEGDFVPAARKAQFHAQRTEWRDLLGRHCPRFGMDQLVVLPLEEPAMWHKDDEYKLMLSFDSDRLLTTWLTVLGPGRAPPLITVTLTSVGGELRRAHAAAAPLPPAYLAKHPRLTEEYTDAKLWPKHVLIEYRWEQYADVDAGSGLFVLLSTSTAIFALLVVSAAVKYSGRIEPALAELAETIDAVTGGEPATGLERTVSGSGRLAPPPPPRKYGSHTD